MHDDGNEQNMRFEPALIRVRKGEQIRFVLENAGTESHEFMLATVATIPPLSTTFFNRKSLFFVSYGLEFLGDLRLTVHTG